MGTFANPIRESYQSPIALWDLKASQQKPVVGHTHNCSIIPPKMTEAIKNHFSISENQKHAPESHIWALAHDAQSKSIRQRREEFFKHKKLEEVKPQPSNLMPFINVYNNNHTEDKREVFMISYQNGIYKGQTADEEANEALQGAILTYNFYKTIYARNSIDGKGMDITSEVHYGKLYGNAFWDPSKSKMFYGDGDGKVMNRLTIDLDVMAHEMTHGVTDITLDYKAEAGGLNESISDIFGIMAKQYKNQLTVDQSDWLIGAHLIKPIKEQTFALRSMKAPGEGYRNHPVLGNDSQIASMDLYYQLAQQGEVDPHDSSGIGNKAFEVTASAIGGHAWEKAGIVWYNVLHPQIQKYPEIVKIPSFSSDTTYAIFAERCIKVAQVIFREEPQVAKAVITGWRAVKVIQ